MKFTDIFVRRPVLATVISLAILVLGLRKGPLDVIAERLENRNTLDSLLDPA